MASNERETVASGQLGGFGPLTRLGRARSMSRGESPGSPLRNGSRDSDGRARLELGATRARHHVAGQFLWPRSSSRARVRASCTPWSRDDHGLRERVARAPCAGEIAGQATLSSLGLRARGIDSHVLAPLHPFGYHSPDIVLPSGRLARARSVLAAARSHDIFHFYFGLSFLRPALRLLDAWALRRVGKRVVVEFLGSDVRMPSLEARRNPYYVRNEGEDDQRALVRMRRWAQATDGHAIVGDHSLDVFLLPHFAHVHYVGQRVDTRSLTPRPPRRDGAQPVVVHAPSHRAVKGTAYVRRAVEELRAAGVRLSTSRFTAHPTMKHSASASVLISSWISCAAARTECSR